MDKYFSLIKKKYKYLSSDKYTKLHNKYLQLIHKTQSLSPSSTDKY